MNNNQEYQGLERRMSERREATLEIVTTTDPDTLTDKQIAALKRLTPEQLEAFKKLNPEQISELVVIANMSKSARIIFGILIGIISFFGLEHVLPVLHKMFSTVIEK